MNPNEIPSEIMTAFRRGVAIPALPLALTAERAFDEKYARALVRYYIDAGVGGLAVGVHSTQFEIRDPEHALFEPVLALASETIDAWGAKRGRQILKISGVCGDTTQAKQEARTATRLGYHASLLSLAALKNANLDKLIEHCKAVAEEIPIIGFYLQPAVGGRVLPYAFWRRFAEIENVIAIKMAPFNRYQTLDVIRAVCDSKRGEEITLYTGNDDNIVVDLLTPFTMQTAAGKVCRYIRGGLLGHWGVWTQKSVALLEQIHAIRAAEKGTIPTQMLTTAVEVTDMNAALFDVANDFAGCIPGIHEILRRGGLLRGTWCLNPDEVLSPGQAEELDRVTKSYPHLCDTDFVREHLQTWLAD